MRPTLVVIAKSPIAGRVKTRCTPPCSPVQAAELAAASLADTLDAVAQVDGCRHVLALDGPSLGWERTGFDVIAQVGDGLGRRLDRVFADVDGPALLIGMDTPQVTPDLLRCGLDALQRGVDAVVGLAADGGFWAVGLRRPPNRLFCAVPMSQADTGRCLLGELDARGLATTSLPELTDVDDFATAIEVAPGASGTRFATVVAQLAATLRTELAAAS